MTGTRPESWANCTKDGPSSPVMPSRSVSPGRPPPPSAIEHQRQPPLLGRAEHAVDLLVVHVALGAGEHGVVVGDHHAAGGFRAEFVRVHGGDARNQAVGRRVLDQIIHLAPPALGGDRERAVFDKGAVIDELGDVLARGALVGLAAPLDRGRAVFVERDGVALVQFGEIGADVIEIDIPSSSAIVMVVKLGGLEIEDRLVLHQCRAGLADDAGHPAAMRRSRPDVPSSWIRARRSAGPDGRGPLP